MCMCMLSSRERQTRRWWPTKKQQTSTAQTENHTHQLLFSRVFSSFEQFHIYLQLLNHQFSLPRCVTLVESIVVLNLLRWVYCCCLLLLLFLLLGDYDSTVYEVYKSVYAWMCVSIAMQMSDAILVIWCSISIVSVRQYRFFVKPLLFRLVFIVIALVGADVVVVVVVRVGFLVIDDGDGYCCCCFGVLCIRYWMAKVIACRLSSTMQLATRWLIVFFTRIYRNCCVFYCDWSHCVRWL